MSGSKVQGLATAAGCQLACSCHAAGVMEVPEGLKFNLEVLFGAFLLCFIVRTSGQNVIESEAGIQIPLLPRLCMHEAF